MDHICTHLTSLSFQAQAKLEKPNPTSCSSADDDVGLQAVVAALRQAKLQCPEDADACCDITNTRAASGSEASSSASSMKEGPDVGPLLALCNASISSCFLQHCLQHNFNSNLEVKLGACAALLSSTVTSCCHAPTHSAEDL